MPAQVVHLQARGGIQRDSSLFRSASYISGEWVRFQSGRPRKIGGYRGIFMNASGISRGMVMTVTGGLNYVISGYDAGLEQWRTGMNSGTGAGPYPIGFKGSIASLVLESGGSGYTTGVYSGVALTGGAGTSATANITVNASGSVNAVELVNGGINYLSTDVLSASSATLGASGSGFAVAVSQTTGFAPSSGTLWQLDIGYDPFGTGDYNLIAHPGQNLNDITSTVNTRPLVGPVTGTAMSAVGVFTAVGTLTTGSATVTFAQTIAAIGAGVSVSGNGIPSGTTVLSAQSISNVWTATLSNNATASGAQTLTFDNNVSVSGGVVMLYPYLFVYGNYGLIQNCSAGDFNNWTSSDANANNVASTKVVKGLPLRGGSTSPAGLFWTLDSVVRVVYNPTQVTEAGQTLTLYWTYDLLTQQSSILSSQCVIEYDGIFYWVGVDRFLMYNGVVQEVPNSMNLNWFFDNLNYEQRQKVWVSKVPRWGEIWWFYPRGNATECTDAIIYNVREQTWYDAGSAPGARRTAGTFSEVFRFPVWGGYDPNGQNNKYTLWQHEVGKDEIYDTQVNAIYSAFETAPIGNLLGLVGSTQQLQEPWMQVMPPMQNMETRIEQVEPDFSLTENQPQVGPMTMYVKGKGYANDPDYVSSPYIFDSTAIKINLREQQRELRLRFESNAQGGDYWLGRLVLMLEAGDVRSTGNP